MAECVVFVDGGFGGLHMHFYESASDLSNLAIHGVFGGVNDPQTWNNQISSIKVLGGTWAFYADPNFQNQTGGNLGPGDYPDPGNVGIANDAISSIQLVAS
jgi:hypothetical protein